MDIMGNEILLSTAYLAPVQYYTKFLKYDTVLIEAHENFTKQTYRNRCKIYGANGELSLSIPVNKIETKTKIKDLLISYDTNWQKLHWKSIESAYRSSPFYEYYIDDFYSFYHSKYKFLLDFNTELQNVILYLMDLQVRFQVTKSYNKLQTASEFDLREKINPKNEWTDTEFKIIEYKQVFSEKYGFIPNLSIIDLLFNEGPNAVYILELS